MSTFGAPNEALFSAAEVCRAVGLEEWAVRKVHPGVFPGGVNWKEEGDRLFYTVTGVEALADEFARRGYAAQAHTLRVLAKQQRETPSRRLMAVSKNSAWLSKLTVTLSQHWQKKNRRGARAVEFPSSGAGSRPVQPSKTAA